MGKKKGGGDDARKAQEAKQKAEAAARQAAEQKERQRQQEQERQRNAGRQQSQQQQQPSVKAGLQQVGSKLGKGEAKDLKQDGYSLKQITKIAGKVETVKPGAQKKLETWQGKAQKAKEVAGAHHGSSGSGGSAAGNAAIRDLMANGGSSSKGDEEPGISAGGSYGTADRNGWLAAELNAIDTFRPNTTPTLFNNYRPTDLSGQLNDAVAEANRFIDSAGKTSSSSTATASVSPSALTPRSLLEEDEQERYGLAF